MGNITPKIPNNGFTKSQCPNKIPVLGIEWEILPNKYPIMGFTTSMSPNKIPVVGIEWEILPNNHT